MIDLKHFIYYISLYENKNFTLAAKTLNIVRQTLSNTITEIESEIGQELYFKNSNPVRFTPFGDYFYNKSLQFRTYYYRLISDSKNFRQKSFSVGTHSEIHGLFPDLRADVLDYQKNRKDLEIEFITFSNMDVVYEAIQNETVECGFLISSKIQFDGCWSVPLVSLPLYGVVSKKHPLSDKGSLTLKDLAGYTCISFSNTANLLPELNSLHNFENINRNLIVEPNLLRACQIMLRDTSMIRLSLAVEMTELNRKDEIAIPIENINLVLLLSGKEGNPKEEYAVEFAKAIKRSGGEQC